jgi:RHH-type proline utilization regulon transcriptional repressor/proline dehydrogenase/delta 1-pyrroline-5-carboxylate dehydrogenase
MLMGRQNSAGVDLASDIDLRRLAAGVAASRGRQWQALPTGAGISGADDWRAIRNPADHEDIVGRARYAHNGEIEEAFERAATGGARWAGMAVSDRAAMLRAASVELEAEAPTLIGLIVREAGKTMRNAVGEIREAVDFLRYYAAEAETWIDAAKHPPLGTVVSISPWNFPLAIFTGQLAAGLAAGNAVIAKPAEETPLIAAAMVDILHRAGVPADVLQLMPGDGEIGASLVARPEVAGVLFTGSTAVARSIYGRSR